MQIVLLHTVSSELEKGLGPALLAGAARTVPGCRTGSGSQGTPASPSRAQATSPNGLLEIQLVVHGHLRTLPSFVR